ncbi:MAG TPA: hypothetical protein PLI09_23215 [Candidatus Hydrogenedentes bacterium]|nr:hypothetical protein [Candidatus Hydrogenedentota bacterium]
MTRGANIPPLTLFERVLRAVMPLIPSFVILIWAGAAEASPGGSSLREWFALNPVNPQGADPNLEIIYTIHRFVLIAMFASTFLFLMVLFASYPRRREHLFVALTLMACLSAILSLHISEVAENRNIWHFWYFRMFLGCTVLSVVFGLALLEVALTGRLGRALYFFALLGVGLYLAAPHFGNEYVHVFPVLCLPHVLYIFYSALKKRHIETTMLMAVSAALFVLVVLNALGSIVEWPEQSGFLRYLPWYGFALFIQIMLVMLAREFAQAMKKVEQFAASLEDQVAQRTQELADEIQVRRQTEMELKESLSQVKTLSGLLPICAACKKVRDDSGYWNQIEVYIRTHSEAEFTHSLCPECMKKLYPQFYMESKESME